MRPYQTACAVRTVAVVTTAAGPDRAEARNRRVRAEDLVPLDQGEARDRRDSGAVRVHRLSAEDRC